MALFSNSFISSARCRLYRTVLAFSYLSGLGSGIVAYISAEDVFLPLVYPALYTSVSSDTVLMVMCLPFLLSVVAVFISHPLILAAICFLKAFAFSLITLGIYRGISDTGYFGLLILCFTDMTSMPVLYFCWQRSFAWKEELSFSSAVLLLSGVFLLYCIYIRYFCRILL